MERVTASALRSLRSLPSDAAGEERLDEDRQPALGHLVDGAGGGVQGGQRAGVVVVDAQQQLARVEAEPGEVLGRGGR